MDGKKIRVVVMGAGNMGSSHARAYNVLPEFELAGIVDQSEERRSSLSEELGGISHFESFSDALEKVKPDAVAICTYPDTHKMFTEQALNAGVHVFVEKPIAVTVEDSLKILELARKSNKKVVVGYILRHHPAWIQFINEAQKLGKPLVMRMNLNQQSKGNEWGTLKHLMQSMSPIVDCGVHYVDVMCQMTQSNPITIYAIGARLTDEIDSEMYNYGQLQVTFKDVSVGWYEAGWGPMMSETAFFIKDVIGPKGSVSIADPEALKNTDSSDIDSHTKTNRLLIHHAALDEKGEFKLKDTIVDTSDEPDHQDLCNREQKFFADAINNDIDLKDHLEDAVNSLKIVLAADESIRTGKIITL